MKLPKADLLPSGSYRCRIKVQGVTTSFTAPTAAEAQAQALAFKAGILPVNKKAPSKAITLRKAIENYMNSKSAVLAPSTVRGYHSILNNRFKDYMDMPVHQIDDAVAQRMINEESKKLSAKTISNSWRLVAPALKSVGITVTPTLPSTRRNERPFLDYEQIIALCKEIAGNGAEIGILLALHGLRRSEIYGLKWDCIDLRKKEIKIRAVMVPSQEQTYVFVEKTKTKGSTRELPILIPQLETAIASVPKEERTGFVVKTNPNTLYKQIKSACKRAGLPEDVGCHSLRHSFASLCHHLGIPAMTCAKWGGWEDLQTMHKIYTHLASQDEKEQAAKIRNFFGG